MGGTEGLVGAGTASEQSGEGAWGGVGKDEKDGRNTKGKAKKGEGEKESGKQVSGQTRKQVGALVNYDPSRGIVLMVLQRSGSTN